MDGPLYEYFAHEICDINLPVYCTQTTRETNNNETVCHCDHLTDFGGGGPLPKVFTLSTVIVGGVELEINYYMWKTLSEMPGKHRNFGNLPWQYCPMATSPFYVQLS